MRIALITTDNREPLREYDKAIPWFGTAPEALLQGMAQMPDIEVHVLGCTQRPMVSSPQKLAQNIWFHSLVVPKIGWLRTAYQGCVRAVRQKLRDLKPNIVHGQGTERECSISAIFSGFPNVVTIHGNMRLIAAVNRARPFTFEWLQARLESFTLPRTGGVVCITRYTENAVKDLVTATWVVPNAVDASFFEVRPNPAPVPTLLCVGVISPRKNQNLLIQALDEVAARQPIRVRFLGAGVENSPYMLEFRKLLSTRPWCQHMGLTGREALKQELSAATMLVLPSLEDNCPMVVLEAMAAGVPVLAANVGGVPELVTPDRTGLLCNPADPASIRRGVETLLKDADLRKQLAALAKPEARDRFHPLVIARRHVEIYREVLKTRS
jgi:glycosyltransferase involved in cell wall biosynthesis